jgi:predicted amidohydrolase
MRTLAALQTWPRFGAVAENLAAARALLGDAKPELLVLPELFSTGYVFRDRAEAISLAEPFPDGPTVRFAVETSASTGGVVVAGYAEREGDRVFNAACVAAGGAALASYRKVHLFGFERECFDAGDGPFPVVEHRGLRVGVMICFDWRFPEVARTLALAGADVIAHPSNLVLPHCQSAMVTRCLENGVYSVTANRVGSELRPPRPPVAFTGASVILAKDGTTLARGSIDRPELLLARADTDLARTKRIPSGNDLFAERRPDTYRL